MATNVKRATSWSHLYELLYDGSFNARTDRFKSRFAFRGVSSEAYSLDTSLMRLGGDYPYVEPHLLRQFKKYGHEMLTTRDSEWYWLSVGQHYGLPTRLLDWSYSPEVALHFATCNTDKYDKDGAVWKVNYQKAHKSAPAAIQGVMEDEKTSILTIDLLSKQVANLQELDNLGYRRGEFFLFFEPPAIDARIFNQFAYFSIGSNPKLCLSDWLQDKPDIWEKIIIPADLKWEIRDKLDQNNISERILFPGPGGIADWLKRYYLPTGSARPKPSKAATPPPVAPTKPPRRKRTPKA